jgi:hypothetical protein
MTEARGMEVVYHAIVVEVPALVVAEVVAEVVSVTDAHQQPAIDVWNHHDLKVSLFHLSVTRYVSSLSVV